MKWLWASLMTILVAGSWLNGWDTLNERHKIVDTRSTTEKVIEKLGLSKKAQDEGEYWQREAYTLFVDAMSAATDKEWEQMTQTLISLRERKQGLLKEYSKSIKSKQTRVINDFKKKTLKMYEKTLDWYLERK